MSNPNYGDIAKEARIKVLELIYKAQTSHIGSNFSAIDIMAVLFSKFDWGKDRFVLSAGWKAASLYYFLWKYGRITEEELNSYCQLGSKFIGLSEPVTDDIKIAGGSMGLGLPGAVGLAFAKKLKGEDGKVYVLVSDGELQCGTTWESLLIAKQYKLDNLVIIFDRNKLQAMGKISEILEIPPPSFFDYFGYSTFTDGHEFIEIEYVLDMEIKNEPLIIHAHTIKGKGVSFMENNNDWHYRNIDKESYELAQQELR